MKTFGIENAPCVHFALNLSTRKDRSQVFSDAERGSRPAFGGRAGVVRMAAVPGRRAFRGNAGSPQIRRVKEREALSASKEAPPLYRFVYVTLVFVF